MTDKTPQDEPVIPVTPGEQEQAAAETAAKAVDTPVDDLPLNDAGTHVHTIAPSGSPWLCPVGYLPKALAQGYKLAPARETNPGGRPGPWDPAAHTVAEVNDRIATYYGYGDVNEVQRLLAAEADGRDRKTVTNPLDPTGKSTTDA